MTYRRLDNIEAFRSPAPKARNVIAQGNALGQENQPDQALKARNQTSWRAIPRLWRFQSHLFASR